MPGIGKAINDNRLIAQQTSLAKPDGQTNDPDRHSKEPSKGLVPGDRFTCAASFELNSRRFGWVQQRKDKRVTCVKHRKHDPRKHRCLEQRADGHNSGFAQICQRIRTTRKLRAFFLGG